MSAPETVRLHISPLTPESYPIVVPASLQGSVTGLSYHQVPTFPEKSFGYIELPAAEAERLKKRLNGALVKGSKIKVEPARPKRVVEYTEDSAAEQPARKSKQERERRSGLETVVRGVELPISRRVRRGWTEPAMAKKNSRKDKDKAAGSEVSKKSRVETSKFTDKEELLFKTKIKKADGVKEVGKKRKRDDDTTIVHEFKQTTKFPSFLRNQNADGSKATAEYDPDKGWVDEEGNVVEGPRRSRRKQLDGAGKLESSAKKSKKATAEVTKAAKKLSILTKTKPEPVAPMPNEEDDETSSSGSSDSEADDEVGKSSPQSNTVLTKETSQSDDESSESGEEAADSNPKLTVETTPKPERTIPSLEIQPESAASEKEVHPLEALFKKPKGSSKKPPGLELKIPPTFTFFGDDEDESEDGDMPTALPLLPQTPFTQADMRFRRERSAAPTPDTAAPTKLLFGPVMDKPLPSSQPKNDEDDSDGDESGDGDDDNAAAGAGPAGKKGRSEFAEKWFWENRGDNNRAWKKRRREVTKQKRYEGNKRKTRSSAT